MRTFGRFWAAVFGTGAAVAVVWAALLAGLGAGAGPVAAAPAAPAAVAGGADPAALRAFAAAFDGWLTELYGCPAAWSSPAECRPELGRFDADGWLRSRRAAARLFGLRE